MGLRSTEDDTNHGMNNTVCTLACYLGAYKDKRLAQNSCCKVDGSALFCWSWGKVSFFLILGQLTKCWRISNWLYLCVAGSKPWHKSVAKAKAMRPQSLPPSCFCTFSLQNVTVSCWKKSMRQAWSIKTELGLLYKLSNIFTMPAWQPMVLMHTQCLLTLIIWTNPDVAGITSDPLTAGS